MQTLPGGVGNIADLISQLTLAAQDSARQLARKYHEATRRRVGSALRPGRDTPLWNVFVAEARPFLKRRGDQAILGRLLGLPRQRVHEFMVRRRRMPDAERMLLLLEWLAMEKRIASQGRKMSPIG